MHLFVSDLHLAGNRPEVTALFLRFLRERAAGADALYILGDLFEAWIGDDVVMPEYVPVVEALHALSAAGTPVFLQHGNRDFLLGERFAAASGCTLLPEETVVDLYGQRALLMHGDTLCTDDVPYQTMRAKLRHPQFVASFLAKTPAERIAFAKDLREKSREETSRKSEYIMDVNPAAVVNAARNNEVAVIIHGHTHRAGMHAHDVDGQPVQRFVLADWDAAGSVLVCEKAGCRLETFA